MTSANLFYSLSTKTVPICFNVPLIIAAHSPIFETNSFIFKSILDSK